MRNVLMYAGTTPYLSHERVLTSLCALNAAAETRARSAYCSAVIVPASCHSSSGSIALSCEVGLVVVIATSSMRCEVTSPTGTTVCAAQKLMSMMLLNFCSPRVCTLYAPMRYESLARVELTGY